MHKAFVVVALLAWLSSVQAQETTPEKYLLTTLNNLYGWSTVQLTDPYLSSLPYQGYGLQVNSTSRRLLNATNERLSLRSDVDMHVAFTTNQPQSASVFYVGGNVGSGLQYRFDPLPGVRVLLGGIWDAEYGLKSYSRDVNNSVNVDLASNLNLAATLLYVLPAGKLRLRFLADLRTPVLGCMFVPERGESYSEIVYLGSIDRVFHLTSLGNRNGLNMHYMIQLPLHKTILNVGFQTDYLRYSANGMVFERNFTNLQVGATYELALFTDRRKKAPSHFLSSEW